jgi:hypothetical protein
MGCGLNDPGISSTAKIFSAGFEVLTAVVMNAGMFWDIAP